MSEYQQKNYISGIFWAFRSKLHTIHTATYITLFLPDSNNWFFVCSVSYIPIFVYYFLILCFYFHLPCHLLLATRHILQVTMFDSTLSQPAHNTTEIRNTSQSTTKEKVLR